MIGFGHVTLEEHGGTDQWIRKSLLPLPQPLHWRSSPTRPSRRPKRGHPRRHPRRPQHPLHLRRPRLRRLRLRHLRLRRRQLRRHPPRREVCLTRRGISSRRGSTYSHTHFPLLREREVVSAARVTQPFHSPHERSRTAAAHEKLRLNARAPAASLRRRLGAGHAGDIMITR